MCVYIYIERICEYNLNGNNQFQIIFPEENSIVKCDEYYYHLMENMLFSDRKQSVLNIMINAIIRYNNIFYVNSIYLQYM